MSQWDAAKDDYRREVEDVALQFMDQNGCSPDDAWEKAEDVVNRRRRANAKAKAKSPKKEMEQCV